jgi:hypothetical protein
MKLILLRLMDKSGSQTFIIKSDAGIILISQKSSQIDILNG